MTVSVRPATRADLELLVAFNQGLAQETEGRALDPGRISPGVEAVFDDPSRGHYVVAELGGRPAGCLMTTREWSDWRNGWVWWIQSVWVATEARRGGVYRALHEDVLTRARAAGNVRAVRLYVERENEGAQRTYAACGMSPSRYLLFSQDLEDGAGA
jgi:ribosomal protein S18 acetylase RimI-like enzyme